MDNTHKIVVGRIYGCHLSIKSTYVFIFIYYRYMKVTVVAICNILKCKTKAASYQLLIIC